MQISDWSKIIAAELAIELQPIDFDKVREFIQITEKQYWSTPDLCAVERQFESRWQKEYPWVRRFCKVRSFYLKSFYTLFSDSLIPVIDSLMMMPGFTVVMLYQENPVEEDLNWHFDGDIPIGFRLLFNMDLENPFLEFRSMRGINRNEWEKLDERNRELHLEEYSHSITCSKQNCILAINGIHSPHKVVPNKQKGPRLSLLVNGEVRERSLICDKLILRG